MFNIDLGGRIEVYKFLYLLVRIYSSTIYVIISLPSFYILKRYLILRLYS